MAVDGGHRRGGQDGAHCDYRMPGPDTDSTDLWCDVKTGLPALPDPARSGQSERWTGRPEVWVMAEVDYARGPEAYPAAGIGFGVGFILAGVLLLLQEFALPNTRWSFVLPLILATVGVLVLISGLARIHRIHNRAVDKQIGNRVPAERFIVEPERWIPPSDHVGAQRFSAFLH